LRFVRPLMIRLLCRSWISQIRQSTSKPYKLKSKSGDNFLCRFVSLDLYAFYWFEPFPIYFENPNPSRFQVWPPRLIKAFVEPQVLNWIFRLSVLSDVLPFKISISVIFSIFEVSFFPFETCFF
jgi:hypothetical protein